MVLTFFFICDNSTSVWQAREAGAMCALFIVSRTHRKEYIENLFKLVLMLYFYLDIASFYGAFLN